jgi:hypothetical protein
MSINSFSPADGISLPRGESHKLRFFESRRLVFILKRSRFELHFFCGSNFMELVAEPSFLKKMNTEEQDDSNFDLVFWSFLVVSLFVEAALWFFPKEYGWVHWRIPLGCLAMTVVLIILQPRRVKEEADQLLLLSTAMVWLALFAMLVVKSHISQNGSKEDEWALSLLPSLPFCGYVLGLVGYILRARS